MKITATKKDLVAALQIASLGVASGDDSDIRTHLLIRFKNGKAQVLSNNGSRIAASAVIVKAKVSEAQEGDAFTIPSWRFEKFVSLMKGDDEEMTLDNANGITKATSKRGTGKWASLDPAMFRLTDDTFAASKKVATVNMDGLARILLYNKNFVSEQENKSPNLVMTECKDGVFWATDSMCISLVSNPEFKESTLRIHGKDIGTITPFLSTKGVDQIEAYEHVNMVFLRHPNEVEGLVGVGRWVHEFPAMKIDKDEKPKCWFTVSAEALKEALEFFGAFAQKDDTTVRFRFEKPNEVIISMASGSGASEDDDQVIPYIESDNMSAFTDAGFTSFALSKQSVAIVADTFLAEKQVRFGVTWVKKNGYVTVRHSKDQTDYFTLLLWHRK